ncbi:DUF4157 domain-containing protein [Streptomyces sp. SID12501]|uniref:DUF4157 domain-containing protein n=1 Tax=Streptomyces sp. SID12501 TaxID=2706042 RepID=A0A6B3C326_9ACTN|nr:DUF4157 domain-containing protein [Streptomyces sp. SID12501]NEC91008.1 DUF4157 domain-containing protein [Streptomyces sp. SID12501]
MYLDKRKDSSGTERTGRRSSSLPAATPLSSLLALQATAGNAVATQAIQRSMGVQQDTVGNTELRRAIQRSLPEHGPNCTHDQADVQRRVEDQPAVQPRTTFFDAQRTPGRPLAPHIQRTAEQAYGMPFGHVRVHDDPVSQQSAEELGASAYTSGPDIYIGPQGMDDETMYHELDHVRQQALGPVAGTDNGTGAKVSSPRDPFEVSSSANGKRVARGEAPDLALPGSHDHGASVQRAAAEPSVQRMEDPHRRDDGAYEADNSDPERESGRESDNSSPDRERLEEEIRRRLGDIGDMGDIDARLGRIGQEPSFRRVRPIPRESDSESSESAEEAPARGRVPAREPMPTLPENSALAPLRELLMEDMQEGDLDRKLKVTFNVAAGEGNLTDGHAWMEVTGTGGQRVSFGFFPTDRGYATLLSVPGGVRCPDPIAAKGSPTHHESKRATLRDVIKGYQLVHGKVQDNYNFGLRNCTTFAIDVWKAMTRKDIPTNFFSALGLLSLGISTPLAADKGLKDHQEQRKQDRTKRMLPLAQGPVRALMPVAGTPEEVAEQYALARQSQSSSSESTEEVD